MSVRPVNTIDLKTRRRVAEHGEAQSPFRREVKINDSYFDPQRGRGKRGRDAEGKTIVFGVDQRDGRVYTEIVPDGRKKTLQKAPRSRVGLDAVTHSDGRRGYDSLVDVGYKKHCGSTTGPISP